MLNLFDPQILKVCQALHIVPREDSKDKNIDVNKIDGDTLAMLDKLGLDYKKNANEVMHTTQTGFGKELVPLNVLIQEITDLIPSYGTFLGNLPGDHGSNLAISQKVPLLGDPGLFTGRSETTTGALAIAQGNTKNPTAEVQIDQAGFIMTIDISDRLLNYSVDDLEAKVKELVAKSAARTVEAYIINADSETGGTGNVNLDDAAPATTLYYMQGDNGIREQAINNSLTVSAGTLDLADFTSAQNLLEDFSADASQNLWLYNLVTYNKALTLQAFYDASQRGAKSTIDGNSVTNILGSDVKIIRDLNKTEADGKISTTGSNNTKGSILYFHKPAIQFGFGKPMTLEVVRVPGVGIQIVASFDFGFGIARTLSGVNGSTLANIINITL